MTHKLAIPILLLTLSLSCAAQELQRTWSLGPLTWDDFTATPTNADENSLLQYNIGFSPVQENIDGIKSFFYRAEAWMLPSSSWVTADHRTPQLLRYNQVIFDMLEVERRTLQRSLNTSDDPGSYSNMLYGANDRLNQRIAYFRQLTQDGTDTAALATFEKQVWQQLDMLPAYYQPTYTPRPFGYSAYFSLGMSYPFGSMGQYFTPAFAIGYGFAFQWKSHLLDIEAIMGSYDARKTAPLLNRNNPQLVEGIFLEDHSYSLTLINIGYGLLLIDNNHMQLSPIIGLGMHELSAKRKWEDRFAYTRLEPTVGVMFRYHFWQQNTFPHFNHLFGDHRISDRNHISLQGKLRLSYSSFPRIEGSPKGLCLTAQVGIAFGGRYHTVE